ncbi:hypothetical protein [Nonomuraea maritima]|uniref:hypothetical protein n=1 Tax=Nonomuraea maritima TaxID=683260 RepID=UPI003714F9A4
MSDYWRQWAAERGMEYKTSRFTTPLQRYSQQQAQQEQEQVQRRAMQAQEQEDEGTARVRAASQRLVDIIKEFDKRGQRTSVVDVEAAFKQAYPQASPSEFRQLLDTLRSLNVIYEAKPPESYRSEPAALHVIGKLSS